MSLPRTIAVIGAGLMGHGIAQVFDAHGHPVNIYDPSSEALTAARDRIRTDLRAPPGPAAAAGARAS